MAMLSTPSTTMPIVKVTSRSLTRQLQEVVNRASNQFIDLHSAGASPGNALNLVEQQTHVVTPLSQTIFTGWNLAPGLLSMILIPLIFIMMRPADAERITGYHVGGISPFGQKKRVPIAMEQAALSETTVYLNGGQRGLQIEIAPDAARAALDAVAAALTE